MSDPIRPLSCLQSPVFLINSLSSLFTAARLRGRAFSRSYGTNLPSSFIRVVSNALGYSPRPPVSVWGTVCTAGLFPGTPPAHGQSDKAAHTLEFVTSARPRNINRVPIDYAFRPRLRGRLTLRGLTLRRNHWTFGDRVSHSVCRYSCQHSHFRYLQPPSRVDLHRLTERSATACIATHPQLRHVA